MDVAAESLSLSWFDVILYKITSKTSETRSSLDKYDIDYMLNINEAIDLEAYLGSLQNKDIEIKQEKAKQDAAIKKMLG